MKSIRTLIIFWTMFVLAVSVQAQMAYHVSANPDFVVGPATISVGYGYDVTESGPPNFPRTVSLASSNSQVVSVPATGTIPAGQVAGSVAATVSAVTVPTVVTVVVGSLSAVQGFVKIVVVPSASYANITYLRADPGQGGVDVRWKAPTLTFGTTIAGYKVVRTDAHGTVNLTPTPIQTNEFFDFTGMIGLTATYQVFVVQQNGTQLGSSPTASAASTTGNSLTWSQNPAIATLTTSNIAGTGVAFAVQTSSGGGMAIPPASLSKHAAASQLPPSSAGGGNPPYRYKTVVNGVVVGFCNLDDSSGNTSTQIRGSFDMFRVTSTSDVIHVIGDTGTGFVSTSSFTFTPPTNLPCASLTTADVIYPPTATFGHYSVSLVNPQPPGSPWGVSLSLASDPTNKTLRSWGGTASSIRFDWDGKDSNGNLLASDTYCFSISPGPGGTPIQLTTGVTIATQTPNMLALVTDLYTITGLPQGPDCGAVYEARIKSDLTQFASVNAYTFQTIYRSPDDGMLSDDLLNLMRSWLGDPQLWDFYNYSHGCYTSMNALSQISLLSYNLYWTNPDGSQTLADTVEPSIFSIPNIISNRYEEFHLVWLDGCNTAGGTNNGLYESTPTPNWLAAFAVDMDGEGDYLTPDAWIGWDGHGLTNQYGVPNGQGGIILEKTDWWVYRTTYWDLITLANEEIAYPASGGAVNSAMIAAARQASNIVDFVFIEPFDSYNGYSRYQFEEGQYVGAYFLGEPPQG